MKPGMQRDILVTLWLLFDDLMDDPKPAPAAPATTATTDITAEEPVSPTANPPSKRHEP